MKLVHLHALCVRFGRYHSVFVCPVSREQASADNPPMMMQCGHVLCEHSLKKLSRGAARYTHPSSLALPCPAQPRGAIVAYHPLVRVFVRRPSVWMPTSRCFSLTLRLARKPCGQQTLIMVWAPQHPWYDPVQRRGVASAVLL